MAPEHVDGGGQVKSSFAVRQHAVGFRLFRPPSFNTHKAESTIEALGRVEIVARQNGDNGA